MARYVVHVQSPLSPEEAFAYMADLTNFAAWDPGVTSVSQVDGEGPGPDASFDVDVKGIVGSLRLRYRITDYDEPTRVVAVAKSTLLKSVDTITVCAADSGSVVTYDATLTLNGPLGLADPFLGFAFKQIGDRAAEGLIRALEGERVREPAG